MTTEGTKEHPAALDAFETAKPDEPIFTLQGGDPLAAPLVQLWAYMARVRAGVLSYQALEEFLWPCANAASDNKVTEDRKQQALLLRAMKAEELSWAMRAYAKGEQLEESSEGEATADSLDEKARLDLHDYRVRAVSRVNNAVAELTEISTELAAKGWSDPLAEAWLRSSIEMLSNISGAVEPRRSSKNA